MEINPISANSVSTSWSNQSQTSSSSLNKSIKRTTDQMAQLAYQLPDALRPAIFSAISDAEGSLSTLNAEALKALADRLNRMFKMMQDMLLQQMMLKASNIGSIDDSDEDNATDPLIDVSSSTQTSVIDKQTQKLMELLYDSPLGYDKRIQQQKDATIQQSLNALLGLSSNS